MDKPIAEPGGKPRQKGNNMKYLNRHKDELFSGKKITYRGIVYWANMVTMEIYAHSVDAEISGVINGYKVADIDDDGNIIKAK